MEIIEILVQKRKKTGAKIHILSLSFAKIVIRFFR
jgi:hypothetical protein